MRKSDFNPSESSQSDLERCYSHFCLKLTFLSRVLLDDVTISLFYHLLKYADWCEMELSFPGIN